MSWERVSFVAHRGLAIQDPIDSASLDRVVAACPLGPDDLAVDIGCGTGEMVARLVERWRCRAVGIDRSELAIDSARRRSANIEWRVDDGRRHGVPAGGAALVASVGATHVFGDLASTLTAITPLVRDGGIVLIGDGYWRTEPAAEWLAALGATADELPDRDGLVRTVTSAGLQIDEAVDAAPAAIDEYNDRWRANLEHHLELHPDDPDADEMRAVLAQVRQWHPDCAQYLGFAILVTRRP